MQATHGGHGVASPSPSCANVVHARSAAWPLQALAKTDLEDRLAEHSVEYALAWVHVEVRPVRSHEPFPSLLHLGSLQLDLCCHPNVCKQMLAQIGISKEAAR